MPVSNIYGGLVQPKSIQDFDNEAMQAQQSRLGLQQNALSLQMGRQKMDEYQRGVQEQATIRNALAGLGGNATDEQRINALKGTGLPGGFSQADALQKSLIEQQNHIIDGGYKKAQTGELTQKTQQEQIKFALQGLAAANDPQSAAMVGVKSGLVPQEQVQQYLQSIPKDPAGFAQWKQQQMMTGIDLAKQFDIKAAAGRDAESQRHNKTTEGLTARGQNMTDARARESTSATMTKPFEVTGPDGTPMLVQQDKQGNITPVQGFGPKAGASKPLNDSQAKALLFGSRMQDSDKILNGMSAKGVDTPSLTKKAVEGVPLIGSAMGAAANKFVASDDQQSVEQAQRDFVNAVLRRESGAAISPSEFDSAQKQYFPAVGDSAQVKTQKAANRQLAIKGLFAEVPAGQRESLSRPTPAASAHPPEISDLLTKYGKK